MPNGIFADFKTSPYYHQLKEFETYADAKARALLWQMRSGKTKVMIDTACYLFQEDKIDTVIVFAPNGVHENWIVRELPIHHWDTVPYRAQVWRTERIGVLSKGTHEYKDWWKKTTDMMWQRPKRTLNWFTFNSESMTRSDIRRLIPRIVKRNRTLVIFDESDDFRAPGSKRTIMARALTKRCGYRRILTGTVVSNSPLAAFSQYELLEPGALGYKNYEGFKDRYADYVMRKGQRGRKYPALEGYKNMDELRDRMAEWSTVLLRSDCDLPDLIPLIRKIELTPEQIKLYRELHKQFTFEVGGEKVSVGENTSKLVKFQQIVNGFLIDEYKDVHTIPGGNPKLEALSEEIYLAPGKVVIWCQFHEDMDRVVERLKKDGHIVDQYHGRTSAAEKAVVRKRWAPGSENNAKVVVGYPQRGLDFSDADMIIWYSHTFNAITREQANERATQMGGENIPILDFIAPGIDEYTLENLEVKKDISDDLAGNGMKKVLERISI